MKIQSPLVWKMLIDYYKQEMIYFWMLSCFAMQLIRMQCEEYLGRILKGLVVGMTQLVKWLELHLIPCAGCHYVFSQSLLNASCCLARVLPCIADNLLRHDPSELMSYLWATLLKAVSLAEYFAGSQNIREEHKIGMAHEAPDLSLSLSLRMLQRFLCCSISCFH